MAASLSPSDRLLWPSEGSPLPPALRDGWRILTSDQARPLPSGTKVWCDGDLSIRGQDPRFQVVFAKLASFDVDFSSRDIQIVQVGAPSAQTLRHLLLDQVYPRILAHEGNLVLHAAAVTIGHGAVLLAGSSGAGKSTLAASMHQAGMELLGDDAVVISTESGSPRAGAVYRSLRLYGDSIREVLGGSDALSPVAEYSDKWNVNGLVDDIVVAEPLPVRAIFLLDQSPAEQISITPAEGSDACMALVEQSFSLDPSNPSDGRRRLMQASLLAASVPKFRLTFPRQYSRLAELRNAIVASVG